MKKKQDVKKLALMGMAAGMLLSSNQVNANELIEEDAQLNQNIGQYLAAGCGKGKCQTANRTSGYSYNSCSAIQPGQHGCNDRAQGQYQQYSYPTGQAQHSCSSQSQQGQYQQHSCKSGQFQESQWSNGSDAPRNNFQNSNSNYSTNNNSTNANWQSSQQQGKVIPNSDQYQAHNSCKNGCNGGTKEGPHDGGKFGAPNSNAQVSNSNNQKPNNNQLNNKNNNNPIADSNVHAKAPAINESNIKDRLNSNSKQAYDQLSPEGKALAVKLANMECKGKNECKGLNACKTDKNSCAGQGSCKGQTPSAFADKNTAVQVAAKKMAEKRNNLQN